MAHLLYKSTKITILGLTYPKEHFKTKKTTLGGLIICQKGIFAIRETSNVLAITKIYQFWAKMSSLANHDWLKLI